MLRSRRAATRGNVAAGAKPLPGGLVSTFRVWVVESSQATTKGPAVSAAARAPAGASPGADSRAGGPQVLPAGRVEAYTVAFPAASNCLKTARALPAPSIATSTGPSGWADSWAGVLQVPPAVRVAAMLAVPVAQATAAWPVSLIATGGWPIGDGGRGPTVTGAAKPPQTAPHAGRGAQPVP